MKIHTELEVIANILSEGLQSTDISQIFDLPVAPYKTNIEVFLWTIYADIKRNKLTVTEICT